MQRAKSSCDALRKASTDPWREQLGRIRPEAGGHRQELQGPRSGYPQDRRPRNTYTNRIPNAKDRAKKLHLVPLLVAMESRTNPIKQPGSKRSNRRSGASKGLVRNPAGRPAGEYSGRTGITSIVAQRARSGPKPRRQEISPASALREELLDSLDLGQLRFRLEADERRVIRGSFAARGEELRSNGAAMQSSRVISPCLPEQRM